MSSMHMTEDARDLLRTPSGQAIIRIIETYQRHASTILLGQCDTEPIDRIRYQVGVLHGIGQVLSILAQSQPAQDPELQ